MGARPPPARPARALLLALAGALLAPRAARESSRSVEFSATTGKQSTDHKPGKK
uniref:Uncharacterized protein n=1 Tax=Molossus molossus TaxID=27622 RepID=A0A7J8DMV6_MOLMO|nr:hypothetical protein HJG59_000286 [Molossus molossus]